LELPVPDHFKNKISESDTADVLFGRGASFRMNASGDGETGVSAGLEIARHTL
jgi:hypothetical protein